MRNESHWNAVLEYEARQYRFEDSEYFQPAQVISKYATGESVLDLGCGPILHLGCFLFPEAKRIIGCDYLHENISFLQERFEEHIVSDRQIQTIQYIFSTLRETPATPDAQDLWTTLRSNTELREIDIRERQQDFVGAFDCVIQIGAFGCLENEQQFQHLTKLSHEYLRPDGRIVWVNWTRNPGPVEPSILNGRSSLNTLLSAEFYRNSLEREGFFIEELHETEQLRPATKERGYRSIVWAVARKVAYSRFTNSIYGE